MTNSGSATIAVANSCDTFTVATGNTVPAVIDALAVDDVPRYAQDVNTLPRFFDQATTSYPIKRGTESSTPFTTVTVAAGAGSSTIATIENDNDFRAMAITFDLSAMVPNDFIVFTFKTTGSHYYVILTGALLGQDGLYTYKISPDLTASPGLIACDHLPRSMDIEITYSVAGDVDINATCQWFN
jgi:hypothetical protein